MNPAEISDVIRTAGVAGAGGAGFPSYVKWGTLDEIDYLLVNHQESEPNYYADKWLGREYAHPLASFLDDLLDTVFDVVVVGTKAKYRDEWTEEFERATDATVYRPEDLPVPVEEESGVVFAYTPDIYTYSEERVLLTVSTGTQIGEDLPTEHGWIVHNTETLYNIMRAVRDGTPVVRKYVHVDGETPRHRCLEAPIGTTATALLEAAGVESGVVDDDRVIADGGPGWCYEIDLPPDQFGVRKRTNAVLVINRELVRNNTEDDGQIDVLGERDWTDREHQTEPTSLRPNRVRIPLITNAAYRGLVEPSRPTVKTGDHVSEGETVAEPIPDAISIPQHASIDGTVVDVTDTHVVIERFD